MPFKRSSFSVERVVSLFLLIVLLTLIYQAFFKTISLPEPDLDPKKDCEGTALFVEYPYVGRVIEPHACAPQCVDQVQRYVVYTNGLATQCAPLPGCSDLGEDRGITCRIPGSTS